MNIDHASTTAFVPPAARESRMRTFIFALAIAAFSLVALLATVVLLFLSARAQMQFQVSPTDIKYAPAQRIPAAGSEDRAVNARDDEDSDDEPEQPGGFGAGIVPGIPGISGGPLFPTSPQAPAYTPAPSRVEPAPKGEAASPRTTPESSPPAAAPVAPSTKPRSSGSRERTAGSVGRTRRVGAKTFARDGTGVLVDSVYDASAGLETVTLVAGSDPYVRLLESRPELRQYFRLDDQLIVVIDNIVYRVVPKD